MKISNDAREALLGQPLRVLGIEIVEAQNKKDNDTLWLHLDTGCSISIEADVIKGLIVKAKKTEIVDPSRSGWCTCPVRPFGNPPVYSPDCPQHKELIS